MPGRSLMHAFQRTGLKLNVANENVYKRII